MTSKHQIEGRVIGMRLTNREKLFIVAAVIVLLGALYYSLFYKGLRHEIKGIRYNIQRDTEALEEGLKSEEKIEDLYKHIDSLETKANWVVEEGDGFSIEPKIIVFLEDAIGNLGLSSRIGFKDAEGYDKFQFVPVTLNFECSYINFRRILDRIEKAPWPYSIDYIKANKKERNSGDPLNEWDVEMVIKFLVFQVVEKS
jgi:hypothetical protein